jgi:nickel-type superoxide dismutase maturation protease
MWDAALVASRAGRPSAVQTRRTVDEDPGFRAVVPPGGTAGAVVSAVAALAAGALVVSLRPRRVVVRGSSMWPTLQSGDRLLVLRRWSLTAGDVVAVRDPRDRTRLLVKRVSSVDGDEVRVAGDNPGWSTDSRTFGPIPRADVVGTVLRRYGPPGREGRLASAPVGA